jgi:ferrochelatase
VAFVSEHSETLVELDIEYRKLAVESGVPDYRRAATVGAHPAFIAGLAALVRRAAGGEAVVTCGDGRICPPGLKCCGYN